MSSKYSWATRRRWTGGFRLSALGGQREAMPWVTLRPTRERAQKASDKALTGPRRKRSQQKSWRRSAWRWGKKVGRQGLGEASPGHGAAS